MSLNSGEENAVKSAIEEFTINVQIDGKSVLTNCRRAIIDECFLKDSVEEILTSFIREGRKQTFLTKKFRITLNILRSLISGDVYEKLLVYSGNNLAVRAVRDRSSNISFVKSCLVFKVAFLGGFVAPSDGLIDASGNCLRNADSVDGLRMTKEVDGTISLICKLCGMLMAPGSHGLSSRFSS